MSKQKKKRKKKITKLYQKSAYGRNKGNYK